MGRAELGITPGLTDTLVSVTWGNGQFVAVGYGINPMNTIIETSPDGIAWTMQNTNIRYTFFPNSVIWGDGQFAAVGETGTIILTSTDGRTWLVNDLTSTQSISYIFDLYDITWSGSQFVAVGNKGTVIRSTPRSGGGALDLVTILALLGFAKLRRASPDTLVQVERSIL